MELPNDQEKQELCGLAAEQLWFIWAYNEVDTVSKNFVCSPCFINRHIFTRDDWIEGPSGTLFSSALQHNNIMYHFI